jgi:hypothetical protein
MNLSVRSAPSLLHALALGVTALVISVAFGGTAYPEIVTTSSVLKATKAAIAKQPGVRVVFVARSSLSSATEKIIADVGATSGEETVSEGQAVLAIKVTPTYGYVSGNSSGFTKIFGLSSANAKRIGTDWVSWKAGTSQYSNLKSGLTMSAVTALLPKAKGTKLSTEIRNDAKLYVLKWMTAATSSTPKLSIKLTVSAIGTPLPIEQTVIASGGTKATTALSMWGEHVLVSTPPAASTIASSKITG